MQARVPGSHDPLALRLPGPDFRLDGAHRRYLVRIPPDCLECTHRLFVGRRHAAGAFADGVRSH